MTATHLKPPSRALPELALRWSYFSSRCTAVPVEVYDGAELLLATSVDQQQNPAVWNNLGQFSFSGSARVVISSPGGCSSSVDAVRFD